MTLTVGSLFSGIGGLELGLEWAGMETVWQVENNDYCRRVLEKHWPNVPKYGDIQEIDDLPYADVVCGGFPCQPVSVAGRRKAQDDERWLWPDFERVVRMVRPRFVVVENVTGLLTAGMGDVLGGLASCGYDAEWQSVSAASVGALHYRPRVFIVAYSQREGRQRRSAGREFFSAKPGPTRRGGEQGQQGRERQTDWSVEPGVDRVVNGLPHRLDRLRALGNAVVPQVAQVIGEQIMEQALETPWAV